MFVTRRWVCALLQLGAALAASSSSSAVLKSPSPLRFYHSSLTTPNGGRTGSRGNYEESTAATKGTAPRALQGTISTGEAATKKCNICGEGNTVGASGNPVTIPNYKNSGYSRKFPCIQVQQQVDSGRIDINLCTSGELLKYTVKPCGCIMPNGDFYWEELQKQEQKNAQPKPEPEIELPEQFKLTTNSTASPTTAAAPAQPPPNLLAKEKNNNSSTVVAATPQPTTMSPSVSPSSMPQLPSSSPSASTHFAEFSFVTNLHLSNITNSEHELVDDAAQNPMLQQAIDDTNQRLGQTLRKRLEQHVGTSVTVPEHMEALRSSVLDGEDGSCSMAAENSTSIPTINTTNTSESPSSLCYRIETAVTIQAPVEVPKDVARRVILDEIQRHFASIPDERTENTNFSIRVDYVSPLFVHTVVTLILPGVPTKPGEFEVLPPSVEHIMEQTYLSFFGPILAKNNSKMQQHFDVPSMNLEMAEVVLQHLDSFGGDSLDRRGRVLKSLMMKGPYDRVRKDTKTKTDENETKQQHLAVDLFVQATCANEDKSKQCSNDNLERIVHQALVYYAEPFENLLYLEVTDGYLDGVHNLTARPKTAMTGEHDANENSNNVAVFPPLANNAPAVWEESPFKLLSLHPPLWVWIVLGANLVLVSVAIWVGLSKQKQIAMSRKKKQHNIKRNQNAIPTQTGETNDNSDCKNISETECSSTPPGSPGEQNFIQPLPPPPKLRPCERRQQSLRSSRHKIHKMEEPIEKQTPRSKMKANRKTGLTPKVRPFNKPRQTSLKNSRKEDSFHGFSSSPR